MSFRKRNIALQSTTSSSTSSTSPAPPLRPRPTPAPHPLGIRPSPLDTRRPVTSTGTASLDDLLGGHGGLALGTSLLIGETGTTDYAGALLRFYAAEGVVQGHVVHVVGVAPEIWSRELPGLVVTGGGGGENSGLGKAGEEAKEKMKIAWRYERLGEFNGGGGGGGGGGGAGSRVTPSPVPERTPSVNLPSQDVAHPPSPPAPSPAPPPTFCHVFDLTKKLAIPSPSPLNFIAAPSPNPDAAPYVHILQRLHESLSTSEPGRIHRLVMPMLLSPMTYPAHASQPHHLLQFLHALRGMLRRHAQQLTAMLTLPLDLYPRSTGLVRWMELLSDGVLELTPFPHSVHGTSSSSQGPPPPVSAATAKEDPPQGLLHVHRLPVFQERGGDGGRTMGLGDDLAFTLSRKRFVIKPFSLPPVDSDTTEPQQGSGPAKAIKNADLDF